MDTQYETLLTTLLERFNRENEDRNLRVVSIGIGSNFTVESQKLSTTFVDVEADDKIVTTGLPKHHFRFEVPWILVEGKSQLDFDKVTMKLV